MNLPSIFLLALAMSTDAFAAAVGKGTALHQPRWSEALRTGAIFGVIEMLTPLVGWALGFAAAKYVREWDHWIAFVLLGVLGIRMIWAGFSAPDAQEPEKPTRHSFWLLAITGFATSIDAMAVGVGQAPGPRFLVPVLPFLALPLAMALRARPLAVAGLGILSIAVTALATLTDPLTSEEDGLPAWWELLRSSDLVGTVATRLGVDSAWAGVLPFLLAVAVACGLALSTLPLRGRVRADGPLLAGAVAGWVVVASVVPGLLPANDSHGTLAGVVAAVLVVALIGVAVVLALRYGPAALLPALPALFLAAPLFDDRPRLALLVVGATAAVAAVVWGARRSAWRPVAAPTAAGDATG